MKFKNGRLIIFAKAPVPGKVKTRLIPALSPEQAAELQQQFILNTLKKATQADLAPVELWCAPDIHHSVFKDCAIQFPISLQTQSGKDVGKRMENAFLGTLEHADWAIIIGTDCPELTTEDLERAMQELENGNKAVIQPAHDGGYVLIGLKQSTPELFTGINWGTSQVFKQTRKQLDKLGWSWKELDIKWDVDRPDDLQRLKNR